MDIRIESKPIGECNADSYIVFAFHSKLKKVSESSARFELSKEADALDKALSGMLSRSARFGGFDGSVGKTYLLHTLEKLPARQIVLTGLGDVDTLSIHDLQIAAAASVRRAMGEGGGAIVISVPTLLEKAFDLKAVIEGLVIGSMLGNYAYDKYKSDKESGRTKHITQITVVTPDGPTKSNKEALDYGIRVSEAVIFARDLINESPSVTTPTFLAGVAKDLGLLYPELTVTTYGPTQMKEMGMEALLGIARGSDEEPRFIALRYHGGSGNTIALVGKGITFDTGGLSLKPAGGMETMKLDMSGAAAVLAVFSAITKLKLAVNVVGLISATENMPGPNAIKPGDVVCAMNGKTIEVLNTDAEGRVVLADAFSYAGKYVKPTVMIDVATLTGACMVALGEEIGGLFCNSSSLRDSLLESARDSGERIWELPLAHEYKEHIKSTIADVKNISGSRYGGAINGALFLEEFVPKGTAWAHLDIAGPSFVEKGTPLSVKGATGAGVALLLSYLKNFSSREKKKKK